MKKRKAIDGHPVLIRSESTIRRGYLDRRIKSDAYDAATRQLHSLGGALREGKVDLAVQLAYELGKVEGLISERTRHSTINKDRTWKARETALQRADRRKEKMLSAGEKIIDRRGLPQRRGLFSRRDFYEQVAQKVGLDYRTIMRFWSPRLKTV